MLSWLSSFPQVQLRSTCCPRNKPSTRRITHRRPQGEPLAPQGCGRVKKSPFSSSSFPLQRPESLGTSAAPSPLEERSQAHR